MKTLSAQLSSPVRRAVQFGGFGLCVVFANAGCASAQQAWVPVWADEFDGNSINLFNWEAQIGTGPSGDGWGNNELQYYTNRAQNIAVANGVLTITARQENFNGRQYTSARLRTQGKRDFKYGRFETRAKVPAGQGLWPAFWMLPTNSPYGGWASSGEIDIVETINLATAAFGTIHYGAPWPGNVSSGGNRPGTWSDGFHVYAIEWEPDEIRWYVDGVRYNRVTSSTWYSTLGAGNTRAPFDVQFHLLLNLAVGGNWPGSPNGFTTFPNTFQVDYVRVSQRPPQDAFGGTPPTLPAHIEAENYDVGGGSIAYKDNDPENVGNQYRTEEAVDIEICSEGGFNVGWFAPGEWVEYTVNVPADGVYSLRLRGATPNNGASYKISVAGVDKTSNVSVPVTSGWQSYRTAAANVSLSAGVQHLRLTNTGTSDLNVNWLEVLVPGDVNADGRRTVDDVYALQSVEGPFLDVNGDGTGGTAADVSALINPLRANEPTQLTPGN